MKFDRKRLGINIHLAGIRHFKLDEKQTIKHLFSLPYQHVRIPIPFDEIAPKKGVWDFAKRDWLLEQAIKQHKTIHLQFGAKTIGWPEIWLPKWLTDSYPYIHKPYACIDDNKRVQEFLLTTLEKAAERYLSLDTIGSIQVENEAFCKRLGVANFRYISYPFHQKELDVVQKYNKKNIPILQNLPLNHFLDMLQAGSYVFKNSDVIGLNVYNQHHPSSLLHVLNNQALQTGLPLIKLLTKITKKEIYITELQTAPWLSGGKPIAPFSEETFTKTLSYCFANDAAIVFLWDVEQIIAQGSKNHNAMVEKLC